MEDHKCPNCGSLMEGSLEACPYCGAETLPKDEKSNTLKKVLSILIIIIAVGLTIGWSIVGVFAFLFIPFVFWDKIGKALNEYLTNKKNT